MKNSIRKNPALQDSPPAAGRASDIFLSAAVRSTGGFSATGKFLSGRRKKRGFAIPLRRLALALLFLLAVSGCGRRTEGEQGTVVSVYYINKLETRITPVERALESERVEDQVEEVWAALRENPVELSVRTPVSGFEIRSWKIQETQLSVDVSEDYKKLSATTEVLVRAALVRSFTQIPGIDHVEMTVNGEALTDSLGSVVGPMTADMFIDNAGNEINAYEKTRIKLYFANASGDGLVESLVTRVYSTNISTEKLVVEQLVAGPGEDSPDCYPVLNSNTRVLGVTVKDGVCYVNFNDGFLTQTNNVTGEVVIYSIANSLIELPNVNRVQIAVNGKTDLIYRETFDLSTIFDRNLDLVYDGDGES